jgi:hypothetical protein
MAAPVRRAKPVVKAGEDWRKIEQPGRARTAGGGFRGVCWGIGGVLWSAGGGLLLGAGGAQPVGVGAGFDDVAAEGEPVDDRGAETGVGEGFGPAIRGWHMLILADSGWCLG